MAGKTPKISDAELQVLQLLWDEAPLGATEIADRIGPSNGSVMSTRILPTDERIPGSNQESNARAMSSNVSALKR